ncbi:MAG TPA: 5'-methylthioadenosine/S-adenosylhomocysteine nucleosidase [Spirochaetota bacterium]|nr:5'-methylthioadenosine/S-adenosylhomocysteine nucleosidase [Spirochaetota bacterium]HOR43732.1 5'-methylthioadenosine/S-adenosylhomocysteine nucleosidase [Spirochaetota bacterium]HOU84606.1 5'-methylthioadenosine/S-adenosylhomocysteine nucleosidase [Spirochaetota bacterium]HPJ15427.1 5'-methylthioadenosine/S-adenosylhomocysteine nucleosidase [Spirochaetota bacterium]HPK55255.1 5'-methylthioadenosine/S-adenosylhomocysteine nucleosidase [Spirochaetota bacterium]
MNNKLGIIIAVKDEAGEILKDNFYSWNKLTDNIYENDKAVLALCGIGKVFASYYTAKITEHSSRILIMGTSGGLSDQNVGDLYLCDEFCEHDMDVTGLNVPHGVTPFSEMKSSVMKNSSAEFKSIIETSAKKSGQYLKYGRIISGDLFICDPVTNDSKRTIFEADLVDMESAAVAKICSLIEKKEVLALRYVSDNANHSAAQSWQENVKKSSVIFNSILKNILNH